MKKYIPLLLILFIFSSCSKTIDTGVIEGTEGLELSYLQNYPPATIAVGKEDADFGVTIQARNAGAYSEGQSINGKLFLGGYERLIVQFNPSSSDFKGKFLEKKGVANPKGGLDLFEFKGSIKARGLLADSYNFNLVTTACYDYKTIAYPSVCIDTDPYQANIEKACSIQPIKLNSQGAPIAITSIEEEVLSEEIQFRIAIKNVGDGRAIPNSPNDCDPFENKVDIRQNIDIVYLEEIKVGDKTLDCRPKNNNLIRLIEGEGFIICKLPKTDEMKKFKQGYTTPLIIKLKYTYRSTIQQPIQVVKRQ